MNVPDYMNSQFIKKEDNTKRDYVFGNCLKLIKKFNKKTSNDCKIFNTNNDFQITIYNLNYIAITFKEDNVTYLI